MAGAYKTLRRLHRATRTTWMARSTQLTNTLVDSMRQHLRRDLDPPYMPPMPGTKLPFREAMAAERPSPLQWPHRLYAELLQPDVLPADLANLTIDTLRHYGGTVLGVVANIGPARPGGKSLLGFISYGYAQMLLRLDRIEEYLLFLYSHRYHDHTRGSWTAGEVSGIRGGTSLFCIPAQQTIPLLVRWMLVLEDSDEERLYFGKAVPREWLAASSDERPIGIERAPTKWGRVSFNMTRAADTVTARVTLASRRFTARDSGEAADAEEHAGAARHGERTSGRRRRTAQRHGDDPDRKRSAVRGDRSPRVRAPSPCPLPMGEGLNFEAGRPPTNLSQIACVTG